MFKPYLRFRTGGCILSDGKPDLSSHISVTYAGETLGLGKDAATASGYYYGITAVSADDGHAPDGGDYALSAEVTGVTSVTVGVYASDGEQVAAGTWTGSVIIVLTDSDGADTATLTADDAGTGEAGQATVSWDVTTEKDGTYTITATVTVSEGGELGTDKITVITRRGELRQPQLSLFSRTRRKATLAPRRMMLMKIRLGHARTAVM